MVKRKIMVSLIILVFVLSGLSGCASLQQTTSRESESLKQAVERFYTYQKNGEFLKAFQYENRSLDKKNNPQYYASRQGGTGIILYDFKILEIGEEGSSPDGYTPVKVKLITSWPTNLNMPVPDFNREVVFDDMWVKKEGKWYHIIKGLTQDW